MDEVSLIVIGSLHTDIVASGLERFPKPGELVRGRKLAIGPGGKSRNIAAMAAHLLPPQRVAMVGRTIQDAYGLWRPPLEALQTAGVNTDFVQVAPAEGASLPAITLIPVNQQGENQIILVPGAAADFAAEDIDGAQALFEQAAASKGLLAVTLECPFETARYAVEKAAKAGLQVIFDPGGLEPDMPLEQLLQPGIYLFKPNEHEARMATGIEVTDLDSASRAATKLQAMGVRNVLITHGEKGAYLFAGPHRSHIPIPQVKEGAEQDATGCGDQTTAALCAYLQMGKPLESAAELAVRAGTLQFHKAGIQPVSKDELEARL